MVNNANLPPVTTATTVGNVAAVIPSRDEWIVGMREVFIEVEAAVGNPEMWLENAAPLRATLVRLLNHHTLIPKLMNTV